MLKVISRSTFDLQSVLDTLVKSAAMLCEAETAAISRQSGASYRQVASYGYSSQFNEFMAENPIPAGRGSIAGRTVLEGKAVQVSDVLADPEYEFKEGAKSGGLRTMLGVPLLREGSPIGVIALSRKTVRPFTDKQIELVETFADQAVIAIENARLLNELRQSLEQQTATADVLRVISSSPGDLEPVFNAMLANAVRICDAKFGVLFRFDGRAFDTSAQVSTPKEYAEFLKRQGPFHAIPGSRLDQMVRTKQVTHTADIAAEAIPGPAAELGGARAYIAVPMVKDDVLAGAIIIYRQEVRPFTDKQIELVQNFAAQAVIAIENTRLLSELRESLQQQTATADVLKVISRSTFDLQTVLDTLVESSSRLCDAYDSIVLLRNGDTLNLAAHYGQIPVDFRNWAITRGWVSGRAFLDREPVHISDLAAAEEFPDGRNMAVRLGFRTTLSVPLLREDESIGVITIRRSEVKPFTEKQIDLVRTFADQAVIAIENVRLFEAEQQRTAELTEALAQQTATSDVLKVISSSPGELEPVFQAMLENAVNICEATFGNLLLYEGDLFRHVALHNAPQAWAAERLRDPVPPRHAAHILYRVAETKQVAHIADMAAENPEEPISTIAGARTVLIVPMLKEHALIGAIAIFRQEVRPFTEKQIALVQNFAAQAVIAIENTRLLNELRQRKDDLTDSLESLRTAQDRLVQTEKLASLGQLTAGIAHEIKNPLNFVNNFSSVSVELIDELKEVLVGVKADDKARVEMTDLMDTLRDNLDKVVQHGKRADAIVKNMLLHSRQGSGEHRPVDVNALVEESLNLAYHGARAEKQGFEITLERSFDPAAGEADLFPQEITRALLNLISNGFYAATKRKAEANGGNYEPTLAAATKDLGDRVEIKIRDNGTGMPRSEGQAIQPVLYDETCR